MTHLRKIMLEELQRRNYSEITTRKYLQYVTAFSRQQIPTSRRLMRELENRH